MQICEMGWQRGRYSGSVWSFFLLVLVLLPACTELRDEAERLPSDDQELPIKPILRLNPENHFATVRRIDVDAAGRWLVSGSHDKTVKVWRLADGMLVRVLRVPQGTDIVGKVYAVAMSPDGSKVVAGGLTGSKHPGRRAFYVFDRATGALEHRIGGLPNVILHLAFSPDGKRLVATLGGSGVRLYRTNDYREIARDEDYGELSYEADFAPDGRLITTCDDGKLRLYGTEGNLEKTVVAPGGRRPWGVDFSPDGSRIVLGYRDSVRVDVLDTDTLELLYSADTAGVDNGNFSAVAWSPDGRRLMAGGRYKVADWNTIRFWGDGGRGPYEEEPISTQDIASLRPLSNGLLAIGAIERIALLDVARKRVWERSNAAADFRYQYHEAGLRLSTTGDTVAFGYEQRGERQALFSLTERTLTLAPKDLQGLALPDEGPREGLEVTDWENTNTPKLNGRPIPMDHVLEWGRSLAIAPDGESFVLGSAFNLRAFDREGRELWRRKAPTEPTALNISGNERFVVVGYEDGTLRWHRMTDGVELLALYPHPDGRRWVLWTPQGYYQSSAGGEDLIGWHVNRGADQAPDFFPVARFRDRFYRPDIIGRVLETGDPAEALRLADAARGERTQTRSVAGILPPTIEILSPAAGSPVDTRRLAFFYHARSSDAPITKVEARVDGRPAKVLTHALPDSAKGSNEWLAQLTVEILPENVTVELIAFNTHGASEPARFFASWTGGTDYYKPDLWVLAVGVSAHPVEKARLKWAAQDAQDFIKALKAQEGGLYKRVHYHLMVDHKATRDEIRRKLNWLRQQTNPRDVAIVFLSGHGFRDAFGDYYFLPYDGDPEEAELSSLSGDDLRRFLRTISGKTVLFLDTCYSGGLRTGKGAADSRPDITNFANELADAEAGVIVFASSTGKQLSIEHEQWRNGAFTEALLEGLDGRADYTKDYFLFVSELETYLTDRVSELTDNRQKPVTTKPKAIENYRLMRVERPCQNNCQ